MFKIGVTGVRGRMGQRISAQITGDKDAKVMYGFEYPGHADIGAVIDGYNVTDDPEKISECDVLIDFSTVDATLNNLSFLEKYNVPVVIGTTGFVPDEKLKIKEVSSVIPVVFAPNMSVGVTVFFNVLKKMAGLLKDYNIYIEETHHVHKKDAPSGTAKKMADIVNSEGFNIKYDEIEAIRRDEVIGDHKIVFESEVDRLTLDHHAQTRDIFAKGAVVAAKWLVGKEPGLYTMEDVLGIK
ncbi:MAG: 4-hydroxy-tetrahydrodipicolinate reductase [Candidatus Omnitrophica bacterium]|nr:4-hydroxy-tetrahydrodipicolinate reductase [Candidatus Omnitrophota bacterium]MDD5080601.1 4-hydroxy-tetrahydrodipicolinate reductase [Candidatus Omnitrophota bacterium]MDD5441120.1 4-hydroxy-tetrahydrodipicolinate reductase [Candidatus Omnitrophota bacterium]